MGIETSGPYNKANNNRPQSNTQPLFAAFGDLK